MELNKEQLKCVLRCKHGPTISNAITMYTNNRFTMIIKTCVECRAIVSKRITSEVIRDNVDTKCKKEHIKYYKKLKCI